MPTFYFHLKYSEQLVPDDEGSHLADVAAAQTEALLSAREMLASAIRRGDRAAPDSIVVTDASGRVVETLHFAACLPMNLRLPKQPDS